MTRFNSWGNGNKYGAKKTYSELCQKTFDSKVEARRGEQLCLAEKTGAISELKYQVTYKLFDKPKISIKIDFQYKENGKLYHEDVKGMGETREFRVKRAWFLEKYGYVIFLTQ